VYAHDLNTICNAHAVLGCEALVVSKHGDNAAARGQLPRVSHIRHARNSQRLLVCRTHMIALRQQKVRRLRASRSPNITLSRRLDASYGEER
jgi:hypothetical protein